GRPAAALLEGDLRGAAERIDLPQGEEPPGADRTAADVLGAEGLDQGNGALGELSPGDSPGGGSGEGAAGRKGLRPRVGTEEVDRAQPASARSSRRRRGTGPSSRPQEAVR